VEHETLPVYNAETIHAPQNLDRELMSPPCVSFLTEVVLVTRMRPIALVMCATASLERFPARLIRVMANREWSVEIVNVFVVVRLLGRSFRWFISLPYLFFLLSRRIGPPTR
jgi:hypothetical protein